MITTLPKIVPKISTVLREFISLAFRLRRMFKVFMAMANAV